MASWFLYFPRGVCVEKDGFVEVAVVVTLKIQRPRQQVGNGRRPDGF